WKPSSPTCSPSPRSSCFTRCCAGARGRAGWRSTRVPAAGWPRSSAARSSSRSSTCSP
ncbi:MAG: hypothetical protein AVDCRST_MAG30-3860, partial [uncultured Solirubrobacteraceae bacterium]